MYFKTLITATVVALLLHNVVMAQRNLTPNSVPIKAEVLVNSNNLSDVSNTTTARANLGVTIGTHVQAFDADLTTYAGITPSANVQTLLGSADYSAFRSSLGVAIGTNVQAFDADLSTWAGIAPTTVGQNIVALANPGAINFLRINADNTVTGRSAADFKTDLSVNNVENTAISTWAGSSNIVTIGTVTSGSTPGDFNSIQVLTSGTTYTPTAGTKTILLYMVGGGGGGGGASGSNSNVGAAGGGGGGGELWKRVTGVTGTYTYAIGAAGTAGAATAGNGGNGGNTTFTNGGTTYTAFGGSGGTGHAFGTALAVVLPGAGGVVSTNGDANGAGEPGLHGYRASGTFGWSGSGGNSPLGGGGIMRTTAAAGADAAGFGGGGGGALSTANTNRAGGAGTAGVIIVFEYK